MRIAETKYRLLYESSREAIMILAAPGWNFTAGNPAAISLFGAKNEEEFIARSPWEFSPQYQPDGELSQDKAKRMIAIAIEKGSNFFEWTHKRINGKEFFATVLLSRMDMKGEVVLQAVVRDISAEKQIAAALRDSEERFRTMVSNIPGAIYRCKNDLDWTMEFISYEIREISGYPASDFIQNKTRSFASIIHPDDRAMVKHSVESGLNQKMPYSMEYRIMHIDGSIRWVQEKGQGIFAENQLLWLDGVIFDITPRKHLEEDLANSSKEWSTTFDSMAEGISIHSPEFEITNVNEALCKMLGKTRKELIGMKCYKIFHKKDSPINGCPMVMSLNSNQRETVEIFEPSVNRWFHVAASPIFDGEGKLRRVVHLVHDITEQKRIDLMKDEFVSTVSHELRTPLSIMKESISQVEEGMHGKILPKQKHFLAMSINGINRITRIVDGLLDISKIESGKLELHKEKTDLEKLARAVVTSFKISAAKKKIELKESYPKEKIEIALDHEKISRVFTNLIANALKFTESGFIEVKIEDKMDQVECSVMDSGIGIAEEDLSKLFIKFAQFGRQSGLGQHGIGLGLSICKGIVELHGGKIWAESKPDQGTKIAFTLPKTVIG